MKRYIIQLGGTHEFPLLNKQAIRKLMKLNVLIKSHDETFMESIGNSIRRNMLDGKK